MYFHFPYFHCKNLFFTAVIHIFRIFTDLQPDYFLLTFSSININFPFIFNYTLIIQNDRKYIINKKFKFFHINILFIFILWYENYHISLVVMIATHEIYIFISLDENKSCIYRIILNILYLFNTNDIKVMWYIHRYI